MHQPKGGRPRKSEGEHKASPISFRPDNMAEYEAIQAEARRLGISVSKYSRLHVLAKEATIKTLDIQAPPAELVNAINRLGTSVFQIWQNNRKGEPLPPNLETLLNECRAFVSQARALYGSAQHKRR